MADEMRRYQGPVVKNSCVKPQSYAQTLRQLTEYDVAWFLFCFFVFQPCLSGF